MFANNFSFAENLNQEDAQGQNTDFACSVKKLLYNIGSYAAGAAVTTTSMTALIVIITIGLYSFGCFGKTVNSAGNSGDV